MPHRIHTIMPQPHVIVAEARSWIGTPYRHQASLKGVGCDCLGLLRGVWREVMGAEPELPPPYSPDWAEAGADTLARRGAQHLVEIDRGAVQAGDVLLFRWRDDHAGQALRRRDVARHDDPRP